MAEAAARLRARYEEVQRKHRGESGRTRELAVATELLARFLPKKLAVASGEVVATSGTTSPQHDILIFDAAETPIFNDADGSVVVPIEGVYAVVEVASTLDRAKLREDAAKIQRLKRMPKASDTGYFRRDFPVVQGFNMYGREYRDFPILGFCFGYSSSSLDTLLTELLDLDRTAPVEERVDMVCTLDHGCIANGARAVAESGEPIFTAWEGCPKPTSERFNIPIDPEAQRGVSLMLFYLLAFGPVTQATTHPLRLLPYMEIR
jgi:hypothetical protein